MRGGASQAVFQKSHKDAFLGEQLLQAILSVGALVKGRSRQSGVGASLGEDVHEISRSAAPPLAMIGMCVDSAIDRVKAQSQPAWVPSSSIDVRSISPAPSDSTCCAHPIASPSVSQRPP